MPSSIEFTLRRPPARAGRLQFGDGVFHGLCLVAALTVPLLAALLVVFLAAYSLPSLRAYSFWFFVTGNWDTHRLDFGAVTFVYGTLVTSALAMGFAVPVSV